MIRVRNDVITLKDIKNNYATEMRIFLNKRVNSYVKTMSLTLHAGFDFSSILGI